MKRIGICAAFAVLAFSAPAHAAYSHSGGIVLPVASPQVARLAYAYAGSNGIFGDVFALPANAGGLSYTLKRLTGTAGSENLEIYFYTADAQGKISQTSCQDPGAREPDGATETGHVCSASGVAASWAIVVIGRLVPASGFVGGQVGFSFTLS